MPTLDQDSTQCLTFVAFPALGMIGSSRWLGLDVTGGAVRFLTTVAIRPSRGPHMAVLAVTLQTSSARQVRVKFHQNLQLAPAD